MRERFPLQGQPAFAQVPGSVGEAARRADPEINAELIDFAAIVDSHIVVGFQRDHGDHKRSRNFHFDSDATRKSRPVS